MNVKIEELSVAVVNTEAPTAAPTTYWDGEKKDDATRSSSLCVLHHRRVCLLALYDSRYRSGAVLLREAQNEARVSRGATPAHATVMAAPPAMSPGSWPRLRSTSAARPR